MARDLHRRRIVSRANTRSEEGPIDVAQTARQLLRAMGGGLLIGLPLLFTMEMWFHAFLLSSWKIVVLVVVAFAIVVGYNAVSGFRRERTWRELIVDSLNTMGISAVVATVALFFLGRIGPHVDLRDAVGKIALELIAVSFGVSLAGTQLAATDGDGDTGSPASGRAVGQFGRFFIAGGGALLFALNVAPTEEPVLLGIEAEWWLLLLVVAASLAMTLGIVFYADFRGGREPGHDGGVLDHPISETLVAYSISLLVALLLLWSFGRTDGMAASVIAGEAIMLGFIASFGGAAGRLLVGGGRSQT